MPLKLFFYRATEFNSFELALISIETFLVLFKTGLVFGNVKTKLSQKDLIVRKIETKAREIFLVCSKIKSV
jgi:hypothetical protein